MKKISSVRKFAVSVLLTAGLAYPACAAVCPKGIGGCPSPGRCFLYVDADTNSLCDYTGRTGSQTSGNLPSRPGTSTGNTATAQVSPAPAPDTAASASTGQALSGTSASSQTALSTPSVPVSDPPASALQSTSFGGLPDTLPITVPLAEVILFLVMTGVFFAILKRGAFGIKPRETRPALGLAAFFGLGTSLILTCLLAGSATAGTTYALVYMTAGTLLAAYLWHAGEMNRTTVLTAAALGTLAGFVFLAPIMPMEIGGIVNVVTGVSGLTTGIVAIIGILLAALITGRVFCGNICPVGSLQQLAYCVPVRKFVVGRTEILVIIRVAIFVATVIAALYLVDLMAVTGLYDLFSLALTGGILVAAGILVISAFLYRPVCRILCPFGVLFALASGFSLFRLQRTEDCIGCGKCERTCPAATAGPGAPKRECYLCARCTDICPVKTGIAYRR
jgi:polyferredoxin